MSLHHNILYLFRLRHYLFVFCSLETDFQTAILRGLQSRLRSDRETRAVESRSLALSKIPSSKCAKNLPKVPATQDEDTGSDLQLSDATSSGIPVEVREKILQHCHTRSPRVNHSDIIVQPNHHSRRQLTSLTYVWYTGRFRGMESAARKFIGRTALISLSFTILKLT